MVRFEAADLAIALAASDLSVLLVRYRELNILIKSKQQRSPLEQQETERGLFRSVVLELLLFAPASVTLMCMAMRPVLLKVPFFLSLQETSPISFYSWLGILSYGFPFVALRRTVTRIALNSLKEFASISQEEHSTL
jgi:hypothetical protein